MNNKSGKLTIYLVRHAQSAGNVGMNVDADCGVLTDRGKIEVNLLGMHLSQVKFVHAHTSDILRAKCTAEGILRHSKTSSNVPLQVEKRLREVDFGIYEKKSYQETYAFCKQLNTPPQDWYFPEGESFPECGERILAFILEMCDKLLTEHQNDDGENPTTVLLVSHTAGIMSFLNILQQRNHELMEWSPQDLKLMRNANYMKFEVQRKLKSGKANGDGSAKPLFQFKFLEKYYSKHLDCINKGSGLHNENVLDKFARSETSGTGKQYVGCVQQ